MVRLANKDRSAYLKPNAYRDKKRLDDDPGQNFCPDFFNAQKQEFVDLWNQVVFTATP